MGLGGITGVLSRYFVLGYFVPAFFTLFVLSRVLTDDLVPDAFAERNAGDEILVLGAAALLLGLVLLALRYPIIRIFEGYPIENGHFRFLRPPAIWLQRRSYEKLARLRYNDASPKRGTAIRLLDRRFHRDENKLLPTRFGNALRAWENYPFTRWRLDAIAVWPRVDAMLTEREQELHTNAMSDLALFVNGAIGSFAIGVAAIVDAIMNSPLDAAWWWVYALPFAATYALYRASIGTAERVGTERRASVDLHRRELYERFGVREPETKDEVVAIGRAINRCVLFAEPIPDDYRRHEPALQEGALTDGSRS